MQVQHGIVPRRIQAPCAEQSVQSTQARQAFGREFIVKLWRKFEGFFAEAVLAHEFQRFFLLRGGDRRERGASVFVADVIAIMIEAADELRSGEQSAIIFAETTHHSAAEDLIAFAVTHQLAFDRLPKLVDDLDAVFKIANRVR